VSYLKDLVTMINPRSYFTLLHYLHLQGRLEHFVNLRTFFPTRLEYNAYLTWAARHFESNVRYGKEVVSIECSGAAPERVSVAVRSLDTGATETFHTRNLVLGGGGKPKMPVPVKTGDENRIFHSSQFLSRLGPAFPDINAPYRFAVVGSGQSAAEIFYHLYKRYPNATVTIIFEDFAFKTADSSKFVNEVFYPEHVDYFYSLAPDERAKLLKMVADTNYSVVDAEVINAIYTDLYADRVAGAVRTKIVPLSRIQDATVEGGTVSLTTRSHTTGEISTLKVDCAVMATGYVRQLLPDALAGVQKHLVLDDQGAPSVRRDYRLETRGSFSPRIYVQGYAETSHGISDTLLSLLSTRAHTIARNLRAAHASTEAADARSTELACAVLES
jgi:L-ornithine N5-oxygenase